MDLKSGFWLVWKEGGGVPTHKHPDFDSARTEAERLARREGGRFHVLKQIDACSVPVTWDGSASRDLAQKSFDEGYAAGTVLLSGLNSRGRRSARRAAFEAIRLGRCVATFNVDGSITLTPEVPHGGSCALADPAQRCATCRATATTKGNEAPF